MLRTGSLSIIIASANNNNSLFGRKFHFNGVAAVGHATSDLQRSQEMREQLRDYIEKGIFARTRGAELTATSPRTSRMPEQSMVDPNEVSLLTSSRACRRALRNIGRQLLQVIKSNTEAKDQQRGRERFILFVMAPRDALIRVHTCFPVQMRRYFLFVFVLLLCCCLAGA